MPGANANVRGLGGFVWSIAEILRGDFKQSEYGKVILPFIVLRRLDCILAATKQDVLEAAKGLSDAVDDPTKDMILFAAAAMSLSLLKFVGQRRRWLMMLCCLHDGFNGTVGLSLSQVFLESISEDGQLAIGLEATEGFLGLQQAGGGPSERHLGVSPAFDVAGDLAHRAERVLDDVGAGERAPEFVRQARGG